MSDSDRHQRVTELLNEALDLPPADRSLFLARACQNDQDLREEIESLLSQVTPSEGLRSSTRPRSITSVLAQVADLLGGGESGSKALPSRIGSYEILGLLGEGGMGAVYLAQQREPVVRQVALKVIHTSLRSPRILDRFHAERNALARLTHPNIAALHEAGTTDDGFPFFAMEHVTGAETLIAYCDRTRLEVRPRVELFLQICDAVRHAHQKGILHRDLKPTNVLVTEAAGSRQVKVIDFGLAKSFDEIPLSDLTQLTAGRPIGTPAYMSPEAQAGSQDLDTRTDVFSLGVVLFELLTGSRPGRDPANPDSGTTRSLTGSGLGRPSTRILRAQEGVFEARGASREELRRNLAGDLDWIVLKALAQDREERYPSVGDLAKDLERFLRLEPVSVGPPTLGYRLRKFVHRNRTAVSLASLSALLLLAALGFLLHTRREAERRTRLNAELTREVERIEWLQRVVHQLPLEARGSGDPQIQAAMERIATRLGSDSTGLAAYALGRGELALGRPEQAREFLKASLSVGYETPETHLALGWALSALYDRRLDAVRRVEDPDLRRRGLREADRELRQPALEALGKSEGSGWIAPELLEATLALQEEDFDAAIEAAEAVTKDQPWLYEARFVAARALLRKAERTREKEDQLDRAEDLFEAAAGEVRSALEVGRSDPEGHGLLCSALGNRINFLVRFSRPGLDSVLGESRIACRRAQDLAPDLAAPLLTQATSMLGLAEVRIYDRKEDPRPALEGLPELLAPLTQSPDTNPSEKAEALRILGRASHLRGNFLYRTGGEPEEAYEAAEALLAESTEVDPQAADSFARLAELLSLRANWHNLRGKDGEPLLDRAVEAGRRAVKLAPSMYSALHSLGITLTFRALGRFDRGAASALDDLREAEEIFHRALSLEPGSVTVPGNLAEVKILEARILRKRGEDSEAALKASLEATESSLERLPGDSVAFFRRGKAWMYLAWNALDQGLDPTEAVEKSEAAFARGLQDLPRIAGPWMELSEARLAAARWKLLQGEDPKEAVRALQESARRGLELDSSRGDGHAFTGLGSLIDALARPTSSRALYFEQARREIERAIELRPSETLPRLAFARLAFVAAGNRGLGSQKSRDLWQEGLRHAEAAGKLDPSEPEATLLRGALLSLDPASQAAGERLMAAALDRNPRLRLHWTRASGFRPSRPRES